MVDLQRELGVQPGSRCQALQLYALLKGTYGEKIHNTFRMTRQGVRWRFQRLFNHVYVEAFETILMIEKTFERQLRDYAVRISKERYELRREIMNRGFENVRTLHRE